MSRSVTVAVAVGVVGAAALAVLLFQRQPSGSEGGSPAGASTQPTHCFCIDADGQGAADDALRCVIGAGGAAELQCVRQLGEESKGLLEQCRAASVQTVRLDDAGCGSDSDATSPACVGGAPDGICSDDEDEKKCLADCGCFANRQICGPLEERGGCATETCCCDDDCVEKGDCCPDACAACGACGT